MPTETTTITGLTQTDSRLQALDRALSSIRDISSYMPQTMDEAQQLLNGIDDVIEAAISLIRV